MHIVSCCRSPFKDERIFQVAEVPVLLRAIQMTGRVVDTFRGMTYFTKASPSGVRRQAKY
jgi:hypothetical protein